MVMKLGALFSGGKDSTFALYKAREGNESCVWSAWSPRTQRATCSTRRTYPSSRCRRRRSASAGAGRNEGEKEKELKDLKRAISIAKQEFGLDGVVTGAVASVYQFERIGKYASSWGWRA